MPSFDVVSKFDMQELDNAVNMVKRDIANRYDFKGSSADLELNKNENIIKIQADNEYQVQAVSDMLEKRAISRKISIKTFNLSYDLKTFFVCIKYFSIVYSV